MIVATNVILGGKESKKYIKKVMEKVRYLGGGIDWVAVKVIKKLDELKFVEVEEFIEFDYLDVNGKCVEDIGELDKRRVQYVEVKMPEKLLEYLKEYDDVKFCDRSGNYVITSAEERDGKVKKEIEIVGNPDLGEERMFRVIMVKKWNGIHWEVEKAEILDVRC